MTQVATLIVGAALLLLGRRLYWIFVAGVGFVAAMDVVPRLVQVDSTLLILVIALVAGSIGAALAVVLQRAAIGIGGFLAAAYAVLSLVDYAGVEASPLSWVLAVVGGVVGLVLTVMLFEWALIVLSSLTGAWMITQVLNLTRSVTGLAFLVLMVVGTVAQATVVRESDATKGKRGSARG